MVAETKVLPIQKEVNWEYIKENFKEHLPHYVQLRYVDYRDDLEYCMKEVAKAIQKNDFLELENHVDDCFRDQQWQSEDDYWKEFKKAVLSELDDMYEDLDDHYGEEAEFIESVINFVDSDDDCYECFRE